MAGQSYLFFIYKRLLLLGRVFSVDNFFLLFTINKLQAFCLWISLWIKCG